MADLQVGDKAPAFTAVTDDGATLKLSSLLGQRVVLYFYPKADTPGCTKEACAFRDVFVHFKAREAVILGISGDTPARLERFKAKHALPFTLLADEDHSIAGSYGVWVEKSLYGRKYMGIQRSTFVIGADGRIAHIFPKVRVAGHADEVQAVLEGH